MNNWESRMVGFKKEEIGYELILLKESNCDYICKNGDIYKHSDKTGLYYKRKSNINKHNGYVYVSISCTSGGSKSKRLHVLLAKTFLENPNSYKIVGHKNNIKNDNRLDNLYWTTNQENTQKAFDDKLNEQKKGVDNKSSFPIAVIEESKIIAVYGSMRECARYIENLEVGYLSKIIDKNGNYKPRSKKYIYKRISREDYLGMSDDLKDICLTETTIPKQQTLFKATNIKTGITTINDNQKEFAKMNNLSQAMVSHAIFNNNTYGDFKFELIEKLNYSDTSAYSNFMKTIKGVSIQNINTNEIRYYDTVVNLKKDLRLKGNDLKQYLVRDNILMNEWKVINI